MGRRIFSFCIFGSLPKYCKGMIKNLEQIQKLYPDFETYIVVGNDVPQEYIDKYNSFTNVKLFLIIDTGLKLTTYRAFVLDDDPTIELLISRDADSRFGARDIYCINDFIKSDYDFFTIRDHNWHSSPIMAGLWGMKRVQTINMRDFYNDYISKKSNLDYYGVDQDFLNEYIYNKIYNTPAFIAYTSHPMNGENFKIIEEPMKDIYDFCGNAFDVSEDDIDIPIFSIYGNAA